MWRVAEEAVSVKIDSNGDGRTDEKLTEKDALVSVFRELTQKSKDNGLRQYILLGFAAAIVLGTAISLLAITLVYKKKMKKLAA